MLTGNLFGTVFDAVQYNISLTRHAGLFRVSDQRPLFFNRHGVMSQTHPYTFEYSGKQHSINADTFIHSLMSLTTIIQEVNRELGTGKPLDIKVKALRPGSFLVNIELLGFLEAIKNLLTADNFKTATQLMGAVTSLFQIRKALSKPDTKVEQLPEPAAQRIGDVIIKESDGNRITVNYTVFQLHENNTKIQSALDDTFKALEEDKKVTGFKILDRKKKPLFQANRKDFPKMISEGRKDEEADQEGEPRRKSKVVSATLYVIRPSFDPELNWSVVYRGIKISNIKMDDEDFLNKVAHGEEGFRAGDILEVDLKINQVLDPIAKVYVDKSYNIIEVHLHKRGNEQIDLFESDEADLEATEDEE